MKVGAIILRYSNGYGHLVVTVVVIICLTVLVALGKIDQTILADVGGPIILFWFMSGSANRFSKLNPTTDKQATVPPPPDPEATQPIPVVKKP